MQRLKIIVLLMLFTLSLGSAAAQDETTLVITSLSDISTLDPALGYDTLSWPAESLVYRGLVTYDEDMETMIPALAESFEVSEDGLTYTFVLREGVMFSNGREITAEDVKYSFERVLNPETASPGAFMFQPIAGAQEFIDGAAEEVSGIRIVDERTVEFTLTYPEWTFLRRLALGFGSIVAREGVEEAGPDFARQPLGAGPFTLESWEAGQRLTFVRNPNYYREGFPKVDRVEIQIGIEPSVAVLRIESGEADLSLDVLPSADYPRVSQDAALSDNLLPSRAFPNVIYLTPNVREAPFDDVRVRQAMSMAIDRERLVQILNNRAVPAAGPIPPTVLGDNPDLVPMTYDPDGARTLLTEAGYANGISTELYTYTDPTLTQVAQAVIQDWSAAGIEAELVTQDFAPLLDLAFGNPEEMPVLLIDWYLDYPDPSNTYDPLIECGGSFNPGGYCNEELDAQENEAALLPPGDERWAAFAELEAAVFEEMPMIPLYHVTQYYYRSERVQNFASHPAYILNLEGVSLG